MGAGLGLSPPPTRGSTPEMAASLASRSVSPAYAGIDRTAT